MFSYFERKKSVTNSLLNANENAATEIFGFTNPTQSNEYLDVNLKIMARAVNSSTESQIKLFNQLVQDETFLFIQMKNQPNASSLLTSSSSSPQTSSGGSGSGSG